MKSRFIKDFKKYLEYTIFSAKSELKAEVIGSHLNWLWWILDPLLFMLVYTFIAQIVFKSNVQYFPIFVFIGLNLWNFFNKVILGSVQLIKKNRNIVIKVYIPKFMLIIQKIIVYAFKMFISFLLVFIMMLLYEVPVSYNVFYLPIIFIIIGTLTFGISGFMLHFGVFVDDLHNIMQVLLRLVFYLSGIFYVISGRVPEPYGTILLKLNPIAFLIDSARRCLLYNNQPDLLFLTIWFFIGILFSVVSIKIIYKYENSYVKVI